jgi:hypothetical protein
MRGDGRALLAYGPAPAHAKMSRARHGAVAGWRALGRSQAGVLTRLRVGGSP